MKKCMLIMLTLVPAVVGYVVNILLAVPKIGMAAYYLLPLLTTVFWLYMGKQYIRVWKPLPALLIAHAVALASLLVYLWQFFLGTDAFGNGRLTVLSQMVFASTPMYLFAGLARLLAGPFEGRPHYAGRATVVALLVIGLIYMMAVFSVGMWWGRRKKME